jgi:hypothetical protein
MHTLVHKGHSQGFSLIEALITIAVFTLTFGGLFGIVQVTLKMISSSKATTSAISLANQRAEYIRSLAYNSIGTVNGIPSGPIPQNSTTTLNGVLFHERVLIQYVDSPDDGQGAGDTNGILADYKQVKVEYSWYGVQGTSTIFLLTNIVPPGIESTAGGGTLTVNVFDATVQPVPGASVRVYNDTTTSTIDTTQFTNASGIATFAGAPAAANYQITVSKPGFSTDKTYVATTSNPNPVTLPVAVVESAVSTMNFQIDKLSDLTIRTIEPPTYAQFTDTFPDAVLIASSTDVSVVVGGVELSGGAGAYVPSGVLVSTSTAPASIVRWHTAEYSASTPAGTALLVHIYDVSVAGEYTLVSEADLPGNTAGFSLGLIDLSALSLGGHPRLALGAHLSSTDVNVTPVLEDWSITHIVDEPVVGSIPFTLTGAKLIGTTPSVYKYSKSHTTDGGGDVALTDLEWDQYDLSLNTGAYDIAEACADIPYTLNPDVNETLTLTLEPSKSDTLRVSVVNESGGSVFGAQVVLSRASFTRTEMTSACGQVFFNSGVSDEDDYQITVTRSGYVSKTVTPIEVDGYTTLKVVLTTS